MNITLTFRLNRETLPTEAEQLSDLWRVAKLLEPLGFPIKGWYPPADTPELSILNAAFDESGPTPAAIAILKAEKQEKELAGWRTAGVWNGSEDTGGVVYTTALTVAPKPFRCTFTLNSKRVASLTDREHMLRLISGLLEIWPAMQLQVQPFKYGTTQKVFPDRPGVGWMLYLPQVLTTQQVPEARALVPVMNEQKQTGTIIVSVVDEPFSDKNPEHVKVANAIEVRLVDQDLLPRYADL